MDIWDNEVDDGMNNYTMKNASPVAGLNKESMSHKYNTQCVPSCTVRLQRLIAILCLNLVRVQDLVD